MESQVPARIYLDGISTDIPNWLGPGLHVPGNSGGPLLGTAVVGYSSGHRDDVAASLHTSLVCSGLPIHASTVLSGCLGDCRGQSSRAPLPNDVRGTDVVCASEASPLRSTAEPDYSVSRLVGDHLATGQLEPQQRGYLFYR